MVQVHVTPAVSPLLTVAVKVCALPPSVSVADGGDTLTASAWSVTVAVAVAVDCVLEVAVILAVEALGMVLGGVYVA